MNKKDLLERINKVAETLDTELAREENAKRESLDAKIEAIKALGQRIKDMLEVAQALWAKRIYIGNAKNGMCAIHSDLVTDGVDHRMGFYGDIKRAWRTHDYRTAYPYAFGIEGGGYEGYGLEINADGDIVRGMPDRYGSAECKMDFVIEHFDEFERKFCDYVESL